MASKKEALPSVNDAIRVKMVVERGVRRNMRVVDLSKVDPDAPPLDNETIQGLLQEVKGAKKSKNYIDFWGDNRKKRTLTKIR